MAGRFLHFRLCVLPAAAATAVTIVWTSLWVAFFIFVFQGFVLNSWPLK